MKEISLKEMSSLCGGMLPYPECMRVLQYEAATHEETDDEENENLYWEDWTARFDECLAQKG